MLTIRDLPALREPIMLCAFTGWADASFVGSGAVRHLLDHFHGTLIAEFDPDQVFSYNITRPLTAIVAGERKLQWPSLAWHALPLEGHPHDLVLLSGPEPDLRWKACSAECAGYARRLGIRQMLGLGAFHAPVPHYGPPTLIGVTRDEALHGKFAVLGIGESAYEGITGFVTALVHTFHDAGIPAAGIWGASPSYIPGLANPKLSAAMLAIVAQLIGQALPYGELEVAGQEMERRIDEALRNRPDLASFLQQLPPTSAPSPQTPSTEPAELSAELEELPTAEEVLRNLEEHLRQLRKRPPEDQPG